MAGRLARCPAEECGAEGGERVIAHHIRGCAVYAAAYRAGDLPTLDPLEAYRLAHPPAMPARRDAPVTPRSTETALPVVAGAAEPRAVVAEVWTWPVSLADVVGDEGLD